MGIFLSLLRHHSPRSYLGTTTSSKPMRTLSPRPPDSLRPPISHPYPLGTIRNPSPPRPPIPRSHYHRPLSRTASERKRRRTHIQIPSDELELGLELQAQPQTQSQYNYNDIPNSKSPTNTDLRPPPSTFQTRTRSIRTTSPFSTNSKNTLSSRTRSGRGRLTKVMRVEGDWDMVRETDWSGFVHDVDYPARHTSTLLLPLRDIRIGMDLDGDCNGSLGIGLDDYQHHQSNIQEMVGPQLH